MVPNYLRAAEELRPNTEQWQAYNSSGNTVILAGPGSGKTKTITVKLARLLNEEIRVPRGLACVTYSNETAREIKRRLAKLGVEESSRVYVGTIHGFCLRHILVPFARIAGLNIPNPLTVADDKVCQRVFEDVAQQAALNEKPQYVWPRVQRYRRTYLDRDIPEWIRTDEETARLVEEYESKLRGEGYIDFDDMVLLGLRLLRQNSWIRKAIEAKFPVLLVDEYQDLGRALHEIVLLLGFTGNVRVIAVGDPDQSIYDFTGANPALLHELAEKDGVERIELRLNYRNGKKIVASSLTVLNEDRQFSAARNDDGTIDILHCPGGIGEQAKIVCSQIIPSTLARLDGRKLGDIAVLYRDGRDGAVITQAVKEYGFKYIGGDKRARYPHTPLTRWLEDCAAWCAGGWYLSQPRISSLINFWATYNSESSSVEVRTELRRLLVEFLWSHRNPDQKLAEWLNAFSEIGLRELIQASKTRPHEAESFDILIDASKDADRLGEMTVGGFGGLRGASDHLNLVTLHSSKGLEFDTVIMVGLEQGKLPSYRANTDHSLREERRLFYVGLTRARYEVYLLYSGWYSNYGGTIFRRGPSEYISEVKRGLD